MKARPFIGRVFLYLGLTYTNNRLYTKLMEKNKYAVGLGKLGGNKTLAKYGVNHFKMIASKKRKKRIKK